MSMMTFPTPVFTILILSLLGLYHPDSVTAIALTPSLVNANAFQVNQNALVFTRF